MTDGESRLDQAQAQIGAQDAAVTRQQLEQHQSELRSRTDGAEAASEFLASVRKAGVAMTHRFWLGTLGDGIYYNKRKISGPTHEGWQLAESYMDENTSSTLLLYILSDGTFLQNYPKPLYDKRRRPRLGWAGGYLYTLRSANERDIGFLASYLVRHTG